MSPEALETQLKQLPAKPGVYLFRGERGDVLYVGKAKKLRPRVRSYFQAGSSDTRHGIRQMASRVEAIETIVTQTEVEALHLEQNLIKRHRPPYNVRLRDDKSFPYIAVTVEDDFPRVMFTRERHRRGVVYFGPYANAKKVRETLDGYFEIARNAIERHGGTIEKFIGDAVMAVWGAPIAREDDAERAVRAALELVDAVTPLGVQARAGVLTGEAAVNVGAVGEGMVVGDIVNTAARLQSVAAPGTVLVGESTYRAASASIAFEPAGEQSLKGKASPVPGWRALRIVAQRGGKGRSDLPEPPFVGRDEELRLLKDLLAAAEDEGPKLDDLFAKGEEPKRSLDDLLG
jgi:hypothetical protein